MSKAEEKSERDERNIVERMAAVMSEIEAVGKTERNREQGYAFRSIDGFMNALHGPLSKHGVVITPRVLERNISERDRVRNGQIVGVTRVVDMLVEYVFHSPDGSQLSVVAAGEGADVADKATNKAMAGALKYAIMQTFVVPTQEMVDADATTPDVPSHSAAAQQQTQEQRELPSREQIMSKLDEACAALDQTRAKLTEKWRRTHDVGPVANLDDAEKVPDLALYRFVTSLQPYVEQALAQKAAAEPEPQQSDEPDVPEPTEDERAAAARAAVSDAICDATDGDKRCTRSAGHDGEHAWW